MNTLEDLYYGNLFPHEKCAKLDDEVKELLKLLNRNEEKLTATLSEDQKETFEKYKDCNREISEISEREIFLNGFRMGARIIIDVVNNWQPIKFCVNNNPSSNKRILDCGAIRLSDLPRVSSSFLSVKCYARRA